VHVSCTYSVVTVSLRGLASRHMPITCNSEDCDLEAVWGFYGLKDNRIVTPVWYRCDDHKTQPLPAVPDGAILVTTSAQAAFDTLLART
jgi:hypothetical protein